MIERSGTIVSVHDGVATIRVETPSACGELPAAAGVCGSKATTSVRMPAAADAARRATIVTLTLAEGAAGCAAPCAPICCRLSTLLLGADRCCPLCGDLAAVGGALSGLGIGLIAQRILARRAACASPAVSPAPTFTSAHSLREKPHDDRRRIGNATRSTRPISSRKCCARCARSTATAPGTASRPRRMLAPLRADQGTQGARSR